MSGRDGGHDLHSLTALRGSSASFPAPDAHRLGERLRKDGSITSVGQLSRAPRDGCDLWSSLKSALLTPMASDDMPDGTQPGS